MGKGEGVSIQSTEQMWGNQPAEADTTGFEAPLSPSFHQPHTQLQCAYNSMRWTAHQRQNMHRASFIPVAFCLQEAARCVRNLDSPFYHHEVRLLCCCMTAVPLYGCCAVPGRTDFANEAAVHLHLLLPKPVALNVTVAKTVPVCRS
jgi:hypothetical protein